MKKQYFEDMYNELYAGVETSIERIDTDIEWLEVNREQNYKAIRELEMTKRRLEGVMKEADSKEWEYRNWYVQEQD